MDLRYNPTFTKEELILVKRALIEFMCLNEDGQDAFEYPIDREIARSLHVRLTMAYNLEGTGIEDD